MRKEAREEFYKIYSKFLIRRIEIRKLNLMILY